MDTPLVPESVRSTSTHQPCTLNGTLEKLDIAPLTPEAVAEYKQQKIELITRQLSHRQGEEISRHDFDPWEYAEQFAFGRCRETSGYASTCSG